MKKVAHFTHSKYIVLTTNQIQLWATLRDL